MLEKTTSKIQFIEFLPHFIVEWHIKTLDTDSPTRQVYSDFF